VKTNDKSQTDAALMITKIEEVGALPFKSPPPVCQTNLTRDGLVRKLRGIQKRAGTVEDYYERFNEVKLTLCRSIVVECVNSEMKTLFSLWLES